MPIDRDVLEAVREMDEPELRRLLMLAKARLEGRTRVYSPRIKPRTVIRETVDDLVDRLFAGEAFPLMQHLIEDRHVSRKDLDALKSLLDDLTEERDGGNQS